MRSCSNGCGRVTDRPDGECFPCHLQGLSFTYRGAHTGRRGWNETTVAAEKKAIYEGAKANGIEIARAR